MYQCGHVWHRDPCMLITLQGLDIVSDGPGVLGVTDLDGWRGGVAGTGGPVPWETGDGGVHGDVYWGPRTITIEGDIEARDHLEYAKVVEELGSVLSRVRRDTLVVDETYHLGLVRQVEVTRTRPVQISQIGPTYGIFTLTVEAADWRRLGVDQQTAEVPPGNVDLLNIGDADADLMGTIIGPRTNPEFSWPGGSWRYNGTVAAGQTLQVDFARRVVRDPATTRHYRNLAQGTWLTLPPGTTSVTRNGGGAGSQHLSWRSSWS